MAFFLTRSNVLKETIVKYQQILSMKIFEIERSTLSNYILLTGVRKEKITN